MFVVGLTVLACNDEPRRKNVLLIGLDTLRADLLMDWGGDGLTPNLDRLANEGLAFLDVTAPSPWTLPSFASLMTGLPPQIHGAGRRSGDHLRLRNVSFTRLPEEPRTLAERFRDSGYETAGFYHNPFVGPEFGLDRGFDTYERLPAPHRAGVLVDRSLEWLRARDSEAPFFLFLHFFDPHTPYEPPRGYCPESTVAGQEGARASRCRMERSSKRDVPKARRERARALYRGEVAYLDASIGRLLEELAADDLDEELVLLAVADHGESFWEREELELELGYHSAADHGKTLFRELLQVPAILRGPGLPPKQIEAPAELSDLYRTLLSVAGLESESAPGRDLTRLLDRPLVVEPLRISDFLLYGPPRHALERGDWKLVVREGQDSAAELYHLETDPGEEHDVAAENPELVASMHRRLEQEMVRRAKAARRLSASSPAAAEIDESLRKDLEALGYLD